MPVKIISYSKPVSDTNDINDTNTIQDLVAYCARVSNPENQNNKQTNEKLIKYLIKNHHWSPLEMVNICLEIETTRDICRQILRHRSFSFQEFSQRYAEAKLGYKTKEARIQDVNNRQNSIALSNDEDNLLLKESWEQKQNDIINMSNETYQWALSNGIAKEQARAVLPEGMTISRMYMNGTLRSWVHYLQLRTGNGTQKEHQEVALECAQEIAKIFPMITELLNIISNESV
jgi:thymidylate synthase (FAD)